MGAAKNAFAALGDTSEEEEQEEQEEAVEETPEPVAQEPVFVPDAKKKGKKGAKAKAAPEVEEVAAEAYEAPVTAAVEEDHVRKGPKPKKEKATGNVAKNKFALLQDNSSEEESDED